MSAVRVVCFVAVLFAGGCSSDEPRAEADWEREKRMTLAQKFPGPWRTDVHSGIAWTLHSKGVECESWKWRAHWRNENEFVVYCRTDATTWEAYLIWDLIEKVMGPYPTDPSLG